MEMSRSVDIAALASARIRGLRAEAKKTELMYYIEKNPGLSVYELAKKIGWSSGRVRYYVMKLLEGNEVRIKTVKSSERVKKLFYPIEWTKMIDWKKIEE